MALVKYIMKTDLLTAAPDETVVAVSQRMKERQLGYVLVIENSRLIGVFSERDLLNRVVALEKKPQTILVKEVATSNPIVVKETTSIQECARIIENYGFRHLPIVNDDQKPVGIISSHDFLQYIIGELEQIINERARSGELFEENFNPYTLIRGSGLGLPRNLR